MYVEISVRSSHPLLFSHLSMVMFRCQCAIAAARLTELATQHEDDEGRENVGQMKDAEASIGEVLDNKAREGEEKIASAGETAESTVFMAEHKQEEALQSAANGEVR